MVSTNDISTITGGTVYDSDGDKIGSVGEIYLDNQTDEPEWVTVKTGMFGSKETFIPLAQANVDGSDLRVPYDKSKVKDAPKVDADGALSPAEEDELYEYYGLTHGKGDTGGTQEGTGKHGTDDAAAAGTAGVAAGTTHEKSAGDTHDADTHGTDTHRTETHATDEGRTERPTTDKDGSITRSEEQLRVGTRTQEAGKAKLRKYVVTEQQTKTVPVSHEEVRVSREPITDASAVKDATIGESEHEVTLHAETPVVEKDVVAVEKVNLGTETVRGEETVSEEVRKEQVEVDDATRTTDRTDERRK